MDLRLHAKIDALTKRFETYVDRPLRYRDTSIEVPTQSLGASIASLAMQQFDLGKEIAALKRDPATTRDILERLRELEARRS